MKLSKWFYYTKSKSLLVSEIKKLATSSPSIYRDLHALFDICSFSFQGAKTGKDNGYTMLFDIESFDYSYYDEGSEGLKVALVHHLDMPIMRQTGFHIAPGTENQVHYFLSKF